MRFGVAEPRVVFEHAHVVAVHHQSEIQHAFKGRALFYHGGDCRLDYRLDRFVKQFFCEYRARRICAHAARVKTFVAVERALVIARRGHEFVIDAVHESQQRHFVTGQKLFYNHLVARRAKLFVEHDFIDRGKRLGFVLAYNNALAERKPVRLDDYGEFA